MKSEQRHELQQNELAARLTILVEWCKDNAALLVGVVAGVVVAFAAVSFYRSRSQAGAVAEWSEFFSAAGQQDTVKLDSISVVRSGDVPGQLANLLLADTALNAGVDLMSSDRTAADEQLNSAKNRYYKVQQTASDPLLLQRAALGIARYFETVGMLDESIAEYEKLATKWPDGLFADMAKTKIAFLKQPSTQSFAKWYRAAKPLPPAPAGTAGMPGLGDLNLPPDASSFPQGAP